MDEQLKKKIKYIRLNGLGDNWDNYLEVARRGNYSHSRLLKYIIEEEYKLKQENSRKVRLSRAKIPERYVIETFASYDFLLIDELGYVEVEPSQVGLFFTLMQKRHKKKHTLITSNLGFSQWTSFLKNVQLTAALIDRLTENSHVINMRECISLRSKLNPL